MEYLRDYRKKNLKKSRIHIKVEQEQMTYTPPLCGGLIFLTLSYRYSIILP